MSGWYERISLGLFSLCYNVDVLLNHTRTESIQKLIRYKNLSENLPAGQNECTGFIEAKIIQRSWTVVYNCTYLLIKSAHM